MWFVLARRAKTNHEKRKKYRCERPHLHTAHALLLMQSCGGGKAALTPALRKACDRAYSVSYCCVFDACQAGALAGGQLALVRGDEAARGWGDITVVAADRDRDVAEVGAAMVGRV